METKQKIQLAYQNVVTKEGKKPESFERFAQSPEMVEYDLMSHYLSFARIERDIVLRTFTESLSRLESAEEYLDFSAREKVLALYFTWFEELGAIREFLIVVDHSELLTPFGTNYLRDIEKPLGETVKQILTEGTQTGEVAGRQLIASNYPLLLWWNTRFLVHYWLKDESEAFERTDAAVEKSVNFVFDLLAPNLLDSGFDLVSFLLSK